MPWSEVSVMDQRREFVRLAMQAGVNRRELCRRFGISPDIGYKWLGRFACNGELADRSRRPHASPMRTEGPIEGAHSGGARCEPGVGCAQDLEVSARSRRNEASGDYPRCTRYCAGTGGLLHRLAGRREPTNVLRNRRRTSCGRWTSRAGCGWTTGRNAIR